MIHDRTTDLDGRAEQRSPNIYLDQDPTESIWNLGPTRRFKISSVETNHNLDSRIMCANIVTVTVKSEHSRSALEQSN